MDPSENNNPSTPFRDLSGANAKTRKAELQKARHAAMSEEKRNEINRKHREARQRKKAQSTQPESSTGGQGTSNNEDPDGNADWLHRNISYQPHYVDVENIYTQIPGVVLCNLLLADLNIGSCILCIMLSKHRLF